MQVPPGLPPLAIACRWLAGECRGACGGAAVLWYPLLWEDRGWDSSRMRFLLAAHNPDAPSAVTNKVWSGLSLAEVAGNASAALLRDQGSHLPKLGQSRGHLLVGEQDTHPPAVNKL